MPGDIDLIAALGDSLTAGFGASASSLWQVPIENRGLVWSIGKQKSLNLLNALAENITLSIFQKKTQKIFLF